IGGKAEHDGFWGRESGLKFPASAWRRKYSRDLSTSPRVAALPRSRSRRQATGVSSEMSTVGFALTIMCRDPGFSTPDTPAFFAAPHCPYSQLIRFWNRATLVRFEPAWKFAGGFFGLKMP